MFGAASLCALFAFAFAIVSASSSSSSFSSVVDFVAVDALPDGEVERHVHYHGITAKETSTPGLTLRQVTDGARLLQLIYESDADADGEGGGGGVLRDCEVVRRRRVVADFLLGFRRGLERGRNVTLTPLDAALPEDVARWLDFRRLREQCQSRHRQLRRLAHASQDALQRTKRSLLLAPGTRWCGPNGKTATSHQLGPMTTEDRCCRQHDRCRTNIHAFSSAFGFFNYRPFTLSHCRCDHRRRKRELLVPGTQWCGKGRSALTYTQLGGFESADKCCRLHDTKCPFYISAFETKYGHFNWRINTIMHCSCDERFRTCLKMAGTGAANLVGKLFFNIVQTKCFVLKPKKVCTSMSYWGNCQKYRYRKQAHLRNNLSY